MFVFIDDDKGEHELLTLTVKAMGLNNKIVSCFDGLEALEYLKSTHDRIFMILCDMNMPRMDGLALKRIMDITPEIKLKAIPFFYHTSSASETEISAAYSLNVQGYFQKASSIVGTELSLTCIFNLWTNCIHPKSI